MPVDTLTNVKTALGVTGTGDDTLLTQLQAVADSFVETFCGRSFAAGPFTEYHPGGSRVVFLTNYPVAAVSSVRVDPDHDFAAETEMPADDYVVHPTRGVVEHRHGPFVPMVFEWAVRTDQFPEAVRVTYTAAGVVPATVSRAYSELVGHWYRQAKTHAAVGQLNVSEVPDTAGPTVYPWGQSYGYKIPPGVKELLAPFRVPSL
jgi:hypothetical protein